MATLVLRTELMSLTSGVSKHKTIESIDNMGNYWRVFDGDVFMVNNMPNDDSAYLGEVIESLYEFLEMNEDNVSNSVSRFEIHSDQAKVHDFADDWEYPTMLSGFRHGTDFAWHAKRIRENRGELPDEVDVVYESWVLKKGAVRDRYRAYYHFTDGNIIDQTQFEELYK